MIRLARAFIRGHYLRPVHTWGVTRVHFPSQPTNQFAADFNIGESFVINLLGGNVRTRYIGVATRKQKRRRVSNSPGLFLRFLVRVRTARDIVRDLLEYQRQCLGFPRCLLFAGRKHFSDVTQTVDRSRVCLWQTGGVSK